VETTIESVQLATPQTPRHQDVLNPGTPRHRVQIAARLPGTPRTPKTPGGASTLYNKARQLFVRSAAPGRLIGRDTERTEVRSFINEGIASSSGGCLYISGPPGTGKSALVNEVIAELDEDAVLRKSYINCMSIKSTQDVYSKLLTDLCPDTQSSVKDELPALKSLFTPTRKSAKQVFIVTLDEIDHLLTFDLEILYTLFEWSLTPTSHLILIGIANALDLTDRFLPRLKARNLTPQLLPFVPYTAPQIASVITTRLQSLLPETTNRLSHVPFVHPAAVQFCAKKVASQTGDLRKAFDIIRRTIDLIEGETKTKYTSPPLTPSKSPLSENPNMASPSASPVKMKATRTVQVDTLAHLTVETAPQATIAHVARITAAAFNNGTAQRLRNLNLQQKAALCALVSLEKRAAQLKRDLTFSTPSKSSNAALTIKKVYEMYCQLCKREGALHPLTMTEFADVVGSLEGCGLVVGEGKGMMGMARATPKKSISVGKEERKIGSCVGEKELDGVLEGVGGGILRQLLAGGEY
jgi:cell division control protein 6